MTFAEITIPAMGEGIIEATIIRWLVKPGDTIGIDTPLVEIATDKVDSEIPSPVKGVITKILRGEGDIPRVGEVIALVIPEGSEMPADLGPEPVDYQATIVTEPVNGPEKWTDKPAVAEHQNTPVPYVQTSGEIVPGNYLSPLVRRIAEELHLSIEELSTIEGTSVSGRITREDISRYLTLKKNSNIQGKSISGQHAISSPIPAKSPGKEQIYNTLNIELVQMDRTRKLIAEHMLTSRNMAPHVTSFHEADLTNLVAWREGIKDSFFEQYGERLSYTPLFIAAATRALKEFPMINVSVDGDTIVIKKDINIGMATALPDGNLVVPVIKNADTLNLAGLAEAVSDLARRARENMLLPIEIKGGTFTITNLGMFGSLTGTPIINQPESAILAVGTIKKKPGVVDNAGTPGIGIRDLCMLSLSYDHRVIDGALGGMFLQKVVSLLEDPEGITA
jgi:2-oxoglutarate dehydrogenase E2 component (dihydrolipoamide succinyltransferase)